MNTISAPIQSLLCVAVLLNVCYRPLRASAGGCEELLKGQVWAKYSFHSSQQWDNAMQTLFTYSYDQLKTMSKDEKKNLGIDVLTEDFFATLKGDDAEKRTDYDALRSNYLSIKKARAQTQSDLMVVRQWADAGLLKSYNDCKHINVISLRSENFLGTFWHPNVLFDVLLDYPPDSVDAPTLVIDNVSYVNAYPMPPLEVIGNNAAFPLNPLA